MATTKRPSARRVLASKNVQVTGFDMSAVIRSSARQMWEKAEAGAKKRDEADRLWKYDTTETYVCIARRVREDSSSRRRLYQVSTAQDVPGCGEQAHGRGHTIESAEIDLRFQLGQLFMGHGVVRDYEEARARACKAIIITERSLALGSRG